MQDVNVSKWCMCVRTKNNVNIYYCLNGLPKGSQRKKLSSKFASQITWIIFLAYPSLYYSNINSLLEGHSKFSALKYLTRDKTELIKEKPLLVLNEGESTKLLSSLGHASEDSFGL